MARDSAIISGSPFAAQHPVFHFEAVAAAQRLAELDLGSHGGDQPRIVPGLFDVVPGARCAWPRRHRRRFPRRSSRSTGSVPSMSRDLRQQVEALAPGGGVARVVEIHQQRVEVVFLERRNDARPATSPYRYLNPSPLRSRRMSFQHVLLIVGDENVRLWNGVVTDSV